jgi:hypothetical protein
MSYETIIWEETGAVGRLTLNRPRLSTHGRPNSGAS